MNSPKWEGVINLPALPERKKRVGHTRIIQRLFRGVRCKSQIFKCEIPGHELIKTNLAPPYNEILLRRKGTQRQQTSLPVVTCGEIGDVTTWPKELSLAWDKQGELNAYGNNPEKVLEAWTNKFSFRLGDDAAGKPGLRAPQVGAIHAICSHFAVGNKFDAATVVLPTGTGKTETMLAIQVFRQLQRTLVIVPNITLRKQIGEKFTSLGVLPEAGIVPIEVPGPHVAIIEGGIKSVADAKSIIQHANVIVALPNSLQASDVQAANYLIDACTDLIVDEAHHVTAATWDTIRERFKEKRIIQFTATPYRRDGKRIDGKIIFNYKLGDAQAAGYYRPINLRAIEEYGEQSIRDYAIAKEALAALKHDIYNLHLDHILMARTRTKSRAMSIASIYHDLASDLNPVVVYSGPGRANANKEALERLLDRTSSGSRIAVCVDMLGEGFDLPNLKVAALHDTHKSLSITLQFIGRFTRRGNWDKIGEATAVANIADPDVESKLDQLYAEGADWDQLIRNLSEESVGSELRLQEVVLGLKNTGDLHTHLSLWNLRPGLSAQYFNTTCENWLPMEFRSVLPKGATSWHSFNKVEEVLVAVICRFAEVKWGNYQNLLDTIYDLLILRWDKTANILCLYASDYDGLNSERIAKAVTAETAELVSGPAIFNILNNVELPLAKNLGSSRIGAISFTSYFGPNVTDGLASIEKAESSLNNIACLGYEDGERVLWGGTQRRGKIWQQKSGTIAEWISWTSATWAKVASDVQSVSNITRDFLRPEKMRHAHTSHPIAVQWGEQAQINMGENQTVVFGRVETPLFVVDLEIGGITNNKSILIKIVSETEASEYQLSISETLEGGYQYEHISGPLVHFRRGKHQQLSLEEYLQKDPFIIRYADGTYSYNCYHIPANLDADVIGKEKLEAWDWEGIPLNKESMHKSGDIATIQYRTYEHLENDYDVIFNDDGCGEVADLVCLKDENDNTIRLCFVHCKGAHEGRISQDIRNFYTLCGQAQKSISIKHAGMQKLYRNLKRRYEAWKKDGVSRFLKGDMKQLVYFREKARRASITFEVILVQPGASIQNITNDSLRLLATTELYLIKTTQASFRVAISP